MQARGEDACTSTDADDWPARVRRVGRIGLRRDGRVGRSFRNANGAHWWATGIEVDYWVETPRQGISGRRGRGEPRDARSGRAGGDGRRSCSCLGCTLGCRCAGRWSVGAGRGLAQGGRVSGASSRRRSIRRIVVPTSSRIMYDDVGTRFSVMNVANSTRSRARPPSAP